jgi:hypothetical protein
MNREEAIQYCRKNEVDFSSAICVPPEGWVWCRFGTIASYLKSTPSNGDYINIFSNSVYPETVMQEVAKEELTASSILHQSLNEMADRATTYDSPGGERSMGKTVDMFNALTGLGLTEEQGWLFMVCLKMVRSQQGESRSDNYVDGSAYFALAGECKGG